MGAGTSAKLPCLNGRRANGDYERWASSRNSRAKTGRHGFRVRAVSISIENGRVLFKSLSLRAYNLLVVHYFCAIEDDIMMAATEMPIDAQRARFRTIRFGSIVIAALNGSGYGDADSKRLPAELKTIFARPMLDRAQLEHGHYH